MFPKAPYFAFLLNPSIGFDPKTGRTVELRFDVEMIHENCRSGATLRIRGEERVAEAVRQMGASCVEDMKNCIVQLDQAHIYETKAIVFGTVRQAINELQDYERRSGANGESILPHITRMQSNPNRRQAA